MQLGVRLHDILPVPLHEQRGVDGLVFRELLDGLQGLPVSRKSSVAVRLHFLHPLLEVLAPVAREDVRRHGLRVDQIESAGVMRSLRGRLLADRANVDSDCRELLLRSRGIRCHLALQHLDAVEQALDEGLEVAHRGRVLHEDIVVSALPCHCAPAISECD